MDLSIPDMNLFTRPFIPSITGTTYTPTEVEKVIAEQLNESNILTKEKETKQKINRFLEICEESYKKYGGKFKSQFYSLHTDKPDDDLQSAEKYGLRDGIQWVTLLTSQHDNELWEIFAKLCGFLITIDDVCIPYEEVFNGTYKYYGESIEELLARAKKVGKENGERDDRWLELAWDDIVLGTKLNFYEKWATSKHQDATCPPDANFVKFYTSQDDFLVGYLLRAADTFISAYLHFMAYMYKLDFSNCNLYHLQVAILGHVIGFDIGKESTGIAMKCSTNFIRRFSKDDDVNVSRIKIALAFQQAIIKELSKAFSLEGLMLGRYARCGVGMAFIHDRYEERKTMKRFPLNSDMKILMVKVANPCGRKDNDCVKF